MLFLLTLKGILCFSQSCYEHGSSTYRGLTSTKMFTAGVNAKIRFANKSWFTVSHCAKSSLMTHVIVAAVQPCLEFQKSHAFVAVSSSSTV